MSNPQDLGQILTDHAVEYPRVTITPARRAVLSYDHRIKKSRFLGFLQEPFQPIDGTGIKPQVLHLRSWRGRRRIANEDGRLAQHVGQAADEEMGRDADHVIGAVIDLEKRLQVQISQVSLHGADVSCVVAGQEYLICTLGRGLSFP
jgi:hypothetical protein